MRAQQNKYKNIKGWGIDADPDNDPTYPMRDRSREDHQGYNWDRPTLQPVNQEVLHSIERPNITAVFGTSVPPRGLSGWIRRMAFKYSENSYGHWLPLLLADRVNVIEGIIDDLFKGHIPRYAKEKGWPALWKYDKKKFFKRVGPVIAIAAGGIVWLVGNRVRARVA